MTAKDYLGMESAMGQAHEEAEQRIANRKQWEEEEESEAE